MNGEPWGELPEGWDTKSLGDIVEIFDGRRIPVNSKERERRKGNIPYFGATGQVGWIDDYIFDEELICLGEDGAPFLDPTKPKAYIICGKTWVNNHAHVLCARDNTFNSYIAHYLNQFDYRGFVNGTTRLKLTQGAMREIPVPLPPLPEQHRIVEKIERLFAESRTAREALAGVPALLKKFRQAVLAKAFRGELTERDPNDEPASALLDRIRAERRRKWEASNSKKTFIEPAPPDTRDLPKLPEGWVWASLAQLAWNANYGTSQKCSYDVTDFPVLRIPNVVNGVFDLNDLKYSTSPLDVSGALAPGDLLVIRTNGSKNLIGRSALVAESLDRPVFFASYLIRYRIVDMQGLANWVALIWMSPFVRDWIEQTVSTSAGQYNISIGDLNKLTLPLPPNAEQHRIVALVESLFAQAEAIERAAAAALRRAGTVDQAVLARAFRGEL